MTMYNAPNETPSTARHSLLGMWCAWVSVFLPLVAAGVYLFARPALAVAPDILYWATFAAGVIGFVLGCVGASTTGRRVDWLVLTPAILGIVVSLALCYFSLALGILASSGPVPTWNQIFPWQGPPPGQRW